MNNCPIQVVTNASEYVEVEVRPRGGKHKDYYAGRDEVFKNHRTEFTEQLDLFSSAQRQNPYTKIAYAKVVLETKAIAKSNHPTEKLLTSANECMVVGGGKRGEMLVRFSPSSAEKIKSGVLENAEDTPKMVLNEKTGEMEAKPSAWRSEVGAIKELRSISAEDRCKFSAEDVVTHIRENGGGYLYVELFETPKTYNALDTDDVEETRKMFRSFVEGLRNIEGVRAYHSSLRTAKRSYVVYMTNEKDAIVKLNEGIVTSDAQDEEISENVADYERLLAFVSSHPVVKRITMAPSVQSVLGPSFSIDGTESAPIPPPDNLENLPLIGVADSGVAEVLDGYVAGRVDNINPKYKDEYHGTFISGMYITGRALNHDIIKERDGNRLVDICVMPAKDFTSKVYPRGMEDLMINLRASVEEAVETTGVRVIGFSINLNATRVDSEYSPYAQELDDIAEMCNVIFVVSAGNLNVWHADWNPADPLGNVREFTTRTDDIVYAPAESVRNLSVGALNPGDMGLTSYTCKGKGLATATKPELVHVGGYGVDKKGDDTGLYSINKDGKIVSDCGTSFSAPMVAKTLAALNHQIEGVTARETLMALVIHSGGIPESFANKKYKEHLKDWIGFGMPADSEAILNGNEHKISLVFHHTLWKGQMYSFKFGWPQSLIKDGKCMGRLKLTVVSSPQLDDSYGEEFIRENLQVNLVQVDAEGNRSSRLTPIYNSKKKKLGIEEEELRESYYKWHPVKVFEKEFTQGVGVDKGVWCLEARYRDRENVTQTDVGLEFTMILTIEDTQGEAPVYDEMKQALVATGVQISDIQTAVRVTQRV